MSNAKKIGLAILFLVWAVLCWQLFLRGGFNLKNRFVATASGIVIFVPLWKKFRVGRE